MPSFPIVDSHVHIYDPANLSYPWLKNVPSLNKPHLMADFTERTAGADVEKIVFVEVDVADSQHLDEVRWVALQAQIDHRIQAIVASMPLEHGLAVEADLAAYAEIGLARGVRRLIQSHPEPGWCLRKPFVDSVKLLPKYGFSFDLCIYHPQLDDLVQLVCLCPELKFIVDHIAKPGIKAGLTEPWKSQMRILAKLPNVWCKISGVLTEAHHSAWTVEQVTPYITHAIDCFGFDRVLFGGDWPVLELAATYSVWIDLVDQAIAGSSPEEIRKLYRDNAIAFYRL
ncbi:MAG: amidohydrolase family protein [Verrucomicrobia bacterium]|nr:amidohydrolase family protein [Verrucomicrobiota bacterium]